MITIEALLFNKVSRFTCLQYDNDRVPVLPAQHSTTDIGDPGFSSPEAAPCHEHKMPHILRHAHFYFHTNGKGMCLKSIFALIEKFPTL